MWSDEARKASADARAAGAHAQGVANLPTKAAPVVNPTGVAANTSDNWGSKMSDAAWHGAQPIGQYTGHITDLLGMWGKGFGDGIGTGTLSPAEAATVKSEYDKRTDPHIVAANLHQARHPNG